jgi:four helix bundle protein
VGAWDVGAWVVEKEKIVVVRSYRELEVWRVAMDLAVACYKLTKTFPKEELFGMTSQIRRAAASIPANIAEGQGRQHTKEFLRSLSVARGSLKELETHLILSQRVDLIPEVQVRPLLELGERIGQMLAALKRALEKRLGPTPHAPRPTSHVPRLPSNEEHDG